MTTKTVFKWFWLWEDEKQENWLRDMAQQGWHLQNIKLLNRYAFLNGTPKDIAYRLDFISVTNRKNRQNYLQLFEDAGWEHVVEYGNTQYFRKAVLVGETVEIYTDNASKAKKYEQILALCIIFLALWWHPALWTLQNTSQYGAMGWLIVATFALRFSIFAGLVVSIIMLARRIIQLRKKI